MREQVFAYDSSRVYGMYYEMSGASKRYTTQFYATDSTNHFREVYCTIIARQTLIASHQ